MSSLLERAIEHAPQAAVWAGVFHLLPLLRSHRGHDNQGPPEPRTLTVLVHFRAHGEPISGLRLLDISTGARARTDDQGVARLTPGIWRVLETGKQCILRRAEASIWCDQLEITPADAAVGFIQVEVECRMRFTGAAGPEE